MASEGATQLAAADGEGGSHRAGERGSELSGGWATPSDPGEHGVQGVLGDLPSKGPSPSGIGSSMQRLTRSPRSAPSVILHGRDGTPPSGNRTALSLLLLLAPTPAPAVLLKSVHPGSVIGDIVLAIIRATLQICTSTPQAHDRDAA